MTETFQGKTIAGRRDAESIAIQVLNFIVADVDRIVQFLNVTGLQPETIRKSATSQHFLLGVLEYAAKDDELLKAIDQELKIQPAAILAAIEHLSPDARGEAARPEGRCSPSTAEAQPVPLNRALIHWYQAGTGASGSRSHDWSAGTASSFQPCHWNVPNFDASFSWLAHRSGKEPGPLFHYRGLSGR